jgi:hypothetical protein
VVLFPAPGGSVRIRIFPASRTWGNNIHANDQERKLCVNHERNNQIETSTSRLHLKRYALMFSPQRFVDPLYTWRGWDLETGQGLLSLLVLWGAVTGIYPSPWFTADSILDRTKRKQRGKTEARKRSKMKTLDQKLKELSSERQKKIETRTARLLAEETTRRAL